MVVRTRFQNNITLSPTLPPDGKEYYVSVNYTDVALYGDITTALVVGQMEQFYILNGDHAEQYTALLPLGLAACEAYFTTHCKTQINKYSDRRKILQID